jgi:hypothetical protein
VDPLGSRYLTDLAQVCRAAGVGVVELAGWQDRARSSGGYDGNPWAVFWHHTASAGNGAQDADYCTFGADDAPVCNLVVGRDGVVYVCAAGATNTNGKGGPYLLPDGRVIPADSANSRVIGMELSNNGVGQTYPAPMMAAAFAVSTACAAAYGFQADNVVTHQVWAPDRKIDPATADAVEGSWSPPAVTSSGTWSLDALRAECRARAGSRPPIGDDMPAQVIKGDGSDTYWAWNGVSVAGIPGLEWVSWGFEAGLYANLDPVLYPQGFVDQLVAAQGER